MSVALSGMTAFQRDNNRYEIRKEPRRQCKGAEKKGDRNTAEKTE